MYYIQRYKDASSQPYAPVFLPGGKASLYALVMSLIGLRIVCIWVQMEQSLMQRRIEPR
jgi:VanZ family protein